MSDEKGKALLPAPAAKEKDKDERLEREPMVHVERGQGKTVVTIDLDQFATEADAALQRAFEKLRQKAEYMAQEAQLKYIEDCHKQKEQLKITDAELARRMDVSRSYVHRLMNATPNLTTVSLAKLAQALGGKLRIELVIPEKSESGKDEENEG